MEGMIKAITKFQNIALITTAGAVGYWYMHDSTTSNFSEDRVADGNTPTAITDSNKAHTLSGEVIARENQGFLARSLETDCEYCLDTRRKLFGMFGAAKKEVEAKLPGKDAK